MLISDMNYPLYRKYSNHKHYFKINRVDEFEELVLIGERVIHSIKKVTILPDRNFISDLIHASFEGIIASNEQEFSSLLMRAEPKS